MSNDIAWALRDLAANFAKVVWAPGSHELWTPREDPLPPHGIERCQYLVKLCRSVGVVTPEDPDRVVAMVYGHLHIVRSTVYGGVPFEEGAGRLPA
jgi:hypothetical protein